MAEPSIKFNFHKWAGDRQSWVDSYRKYDFPVTVRKVGDVVAPAQPDK